MMQNLDVLVDVSLNKLFNKQSSGWWLVMPSCLCVTTVMFWSWTDNNPFHHRSYWCHGAKAPGHQYLQRRLTICSIGPPVSYRNILYTGNNIRKRNVILKKIPSSKLFNTLRPKQNGRCFADDTFKRIFLNENVRILIKISLNFVPRGPMNYIPSLDQIMACHLVGASPLS